MQKKSKGSCLIIVLLLGVMLLAISSVVLKVIEQRKIKTEQYIPNETNMKILGRTHCVEDTLWLVMPGSGAEFTFKGTFAKVTLQADDMSYQGDKNSQARVAIYVNDKCVVDDMIDKQEETYEIFASEKAKECKISIIKLSESPYSTVGIKNVEVTSKSGIKPTPAKAHYIEFIGDSLICGYGVEDDEISNPFSTTTGNVMKAYAYQTAKALKADYSMVAYSGYGVVSGCSENGEKNEKELVPLYYAKLGFSRTTYKGYQPADIEWDFTKRQPDLIVINLGSNDDTYTLDDSVKQEEYAVAYAVFLKEIRNANPNAVILCTLGMFGDRLFPQMEKAVEMYRTETGDSNIHTFKMEYFSIEDGYAAGGHPTESAHGECAKELISYIKGLMKW